MKIESVGRGIEGSVVVEVSTKSVFQGRDFVRFRRLQNGEWQRKELENFEDFDIELIRSVFMAPLDAVAETFEYLQAKRKQMAARIEERERAEMVGHIHDDAVRATAEKEAFATLERNGWGIIWKNEDTRNGRIVSVIQMRKMRKVNNGDN